MQHEIETLDRRISDLEDVELDVMERLETAQAHVRRAVAGARAARRARSPRRRSPATSRPATSRSSATTRRGARDAGAEQIPEPLLALYDKLRAQLGGVGVGVIQHKRCGGCRLDIGAAELARMAAAPSDEVLRCEECNRILVRTHESGL